MYQDFLYTLAQKKILTNQKEKNVHSGDNFPLVSLKKKNTTNKQFILMKQRYLIQLVKDI